MLNNILIFCLFLVCAVKSQNPCLTPNGEYSQCVPIRSCRILLNALNSRSSIQIQFLRDSACGYTGGNPDVCCGSYDNYINTAATNNDRPSSTTTPKRRVASTKASGGNRIANKILPDRSTCGIQAPDRILGGTQTELDEFPWTALLGYNYKNRSTLFSCGGSLISSRYVLTAAHCVAGSILTKIGPLSTVRLGEWNTKTDRDCINQFGIETCSDPPLDFGIAQVIAHNGFNDKLRSVYNDIALIRMDRPVKFTNFIQPICLPQSENLEIGRSGYAVGWGRTEYASASDKKLKVQLPIVSMDQCAKLFRSKKVYLSENQFCAGGISGKDSCAGDSGGPLIATTREDSSQWYLEGIVSFGYGCGLQNWPGVLTKVSRYMDWINKNIKA